jgi:ribose transport system permease protein
MTLPEPSVPTAEADDAVALRPAAPGMTAVRSGGWGRWFLSNEFGLLALILIFAALFGIFTPGFTSKFNLFTLGRTMAIDIMIGFSMMVVIVTGGLNLAVGAIGVSAAMSFGWLIEGAGLPWPVAILGGLAMGGLLGWINGFAIVRSGLHSFIITLATMSIFFGAMVFITRAEAFRNLPPVMAQFGKMRIGDYTSPLLLVSAGVGLLLVVLYRLTVLGRSMLAAGAKAPAAELSGVRVGRTIILCHVLSGVLAAIAALMVVARTGAAIPSCLL